MFAPPRTASFEMVEIMADASPTVEFLERLAAQTIEGSRRFARLYLAVLFNPGHEISETAAGSRWSFPLAMILGHSLLTAVLLRVGWPLGARGAGLSEAVAGSRINVPVVFLALIVFLVSLSVLTLLGVRVFARQRAGLLPAMNCVAVAAVPLSALTVAAWMVLYLSPALSLLVLFFGALSAVGFFAEALRSQCDMSVGSCLYVIPLTVVVALLITAFFLLALGGRA